MVQQGEERVRSRRKNTRVTEGENRVNGRKRKCERTVRNVSYVRTRNAVRDARPCGPRVSHARITTQAYLCVCARVHMYVHIVMCVPLAVCWESVGNRIHVILHCVTSLLHFA